MTYVVTHPGKAHRDDFLSCCLLIAKHDVNSIERREPSKSEFSDKNVVIVDVGLQLDPANRNYDHHQRSRDAEPFCALSAVIKHELKMEKEFRLHSWVEFTERVDSKGPHATSSYYGWDEFPFVTTSPIESVLLDIFGQTTFVQHGSELFGMMRMIGEQIMAYVSEYAERLYCCEKQCIAVEVDGLCGVAMLGPVDLVPFINAVKMKKFPDAVFSLTLDDRGDGMCLYRFDDYPGLDFYKLEGLSGIEFAHKGGFIAKTKSVLDEEQWSNLIRQASVV